MTLLVVIFPLNIKEKEQKTQEFTTAILSSI